ncbi:hypothetical protein [Nocardia farcinica]|uniref:hypothetical protein n=1 Tax=Nocardia farcinica TaxID=37329 RepID=UPI00245815F8|nr:hypothetical protein [Nocardia farcinica]
MRLLSLDYDPVCGEDCDRATFGSDVSVFDYDMVIWDPAGAVDAYFLVGYGSEYYQSLPRISDHNSVKLRSDIERRRAEFAEFLRAGRVVVTIVRPPQRCYVATGEVRYSGTGRNRQAQHIVTEVDVLSALPISDFKPTVAAGNRISIEGDGAIQKFLRKYKHLLTYEAVMSSAPGKPLALVSGTDRVVGSILKTKESGLLVLLPPLDLTDESGEDSDEDGWIDEAPTVQQDLIDAIKKITETVVSSRPAWASKYTTKDQADVRNAVVKQQRQVEAARAKLATLQQRKEESELKDQLFLGTGRALELEVKAVLELLGGEVTEPEPGRDDWKVRFPERNAVVEVKGLSKSAAEKHAAQLEKWVAGEMEETGTRPKGILIVNTWRELELSERTEKDFPDQMVPYSVSREHCLMTGLQLFVIRAEIEENPSRAEYWRKEILRTSGIIKGADDWKTILVQSVSNDAQGE